MHPIETHGRDRCGRHLSPGDGLAVLFLLITFLGGCESVPHDLESHEMLNATLWQQSSAEYQGVALQSYQLARSNLDRALLDPQWHAVPGQPGSTADLPPAILLDLDETVLDNTEYEVRIIKRLGQYSPESFADWCHAAGAAAVPGVADFLRYAVDRGVAVFYYSARKETLRDCTTSNLRALQLPLADMSHLLLNDGRSKSVFRAMVAREYRVLLLVGDNLEDFVEGSKGTPTERRSLAKDNAERWGREWILLPNPMYGHWESSNYGFDYRLQREDQLQLKLQGLRE